MDIKFLGEIEDVQERLEVGHVFLPLLLTSFGNSSSHIQVDLRASVGLEGYRRNIGDEIGALFVFSLAVLLVFNRFNRCTAELIRQKLGVRRSAFNT